MTDRELSPATVPMANTAGTMLRAARLAQGLQIAALASQVKVPAARLEALEADRYDQLPDTTFTRALAKTLCRVLKIDSQPVLALLPGAPPMGLERVDGGLNTPFHDRPGRVDPAQWVPWRRPVPWAVGALLVAAAAFVLVPMRGDLQPPPNRTPIMPPADTAAPGADPVAPAASSPLATVPGAAASAVGSPGAQATPVAADMPTATASGATPSVADLGDKAVLRALQDTWVQASDASGQVLLSRLIPAGETVEFTGTLPLRVRIGNVAGTELAFRGQPVAVKSADRGNVATVTLP